MRPNETGRAPSHHEHDFEKMRRYQFFYDLVNEAVNPMREDGPPLGIYLLNRFQYQVPEKDDDDFVRVVDAVLANLDESDRGVSRKDIEEWILESTKQLLVSYGYLPSGTPEREPLTDEVIDVKIHERVGGDTRFLAHSTRKYVVKSLVLPDPFRQDNLRVNVDNLAKMVAGDFPFSVSWHRVRDRVNFWIRSNITRIRNEKMKAVFGLQYL